MVAAVVTYSLACSGIGLYVGWIWLRQRRLSRRIRELEFHAARPLQREEVHSRAA
jgi:hypothetical protein